MSADNLIVLLPEIGLHLLMLVSLFILALTRKFSIKNKLISMTVVALIILTGISMLVTAGTDLSILDQQLLVTKELGMSRLALLFSVLACVYLVSYGGEVPAGRRAELLVINLGLAILGFYFIYSQNIFLNYTILLGQYLLLAVLFFFLDKNPLSSSGVMKYWKYGSFVFAIGFAGLLAYSITSDSFHFSDVRPYFSADNKLLVFVLFALMAPYLFIIGLFPFVSINVDLAQSSYWTAQAGQVLLVRLPVSLGFLNMSLKLFSGSEAYPAKLVLLAISVLGVITVFLSILISLTHMRMKRVAAMASIAMVGLVAIALPGLRDVVALSVNYQFVNGSLSFAILFLVLAKLYSIADSQDVSFLDGKGWDQKFECLVLICSIFSIVAMPPFLGFQSTLRLYESLYRSDMPVHSIFLFMAQVLFALLAVRIIRRVYFSKSVESGVVIDRASIERQALLFLFLAPLVLLGLIDISLVEIFLLS